MDNESPARLGVGALAIVGGLLYAAFRRRFLGDTPKTHIDRKQLRFDVEDLNRAHRLADGPVRVILIRQSGHVHRDLGEFNSPDAAIRQVQTAFRRAKIETVVVGVNTSSHFSIRRFIFNHRGSSEGKRLGGAELSSAS